MCVDCGFWSLFRYPWTCKLFIRAFKYKFVRNSWTGKNTCYKQRNKHSSLLLGQRVKLPMLLRRWERQSAQSFRFLRIHKMGWRACCPSPRRTKRKELCRIISMVPPCFHLFIVPPHRHMSRGWSHKLFVDSGTWKGWSIITQNVSY